MQLVIYERSGGLQRSDKVEVDTAQVETLSEMVRWRYGEPKQVAMIRLADGRSYLVEDEGRRLYPAVCEANESATICRKA